MRVGDFGSAVGDGGEALEGKNRQGHRRNEAHRRRVRHGLRCCGELKAAGPEGGDAEQCDAAHLDGRHDQRKAANRTVACDVDEEGEHDHGDGEDRDQGAAGNLEGPQDIGGEGPGDQTLGDDHAQRHQQRRAGGDRAWAVAFLQDHPDSARRGPGVRHLDVAVGTEAGDDRARDEGEWKERPGQLRDLARQSKDAGAYHHAGAHRHRPAQGDRALSVSAVLMIVLHIAPCRHQRAA